MLTSQCAVSTSLLVSPSAVSCYPASMVNLIWFANENVYCVSTKQHGDMKSGVLRSKTATICKLGVLDCNVLLEHVKVQLSPQTCKCDRFAHFCGCNCKTLKKLSLANQIFHHRSMVATDSTS